MNFEPQKFFLGMLDFFSILLPGAVLAYLGKDWASGLLLGRDFPLDGPEAWLVFLFASYLLGHFAFLLGSYLDDGVYDPFRNCTYRGQLARLAEGKGLSRAWWRKQARRRFGGNPDGAVLVVERLKARALRPLAAERAINAYQWCKVRLSSAHPEGLVAVERFEAASKFFRSFCVVLFVLALVLALRERPVAPPERWLPVAICLGLLYLALLRYVDQRFKATQQAYWFLLALESAADPPAPAAPAPDGPGHAGGVVFRDDRPTVEYLLVQASRNRRQWVLPKGHIEPGEDPPTAAVREVKEETGHWAKVVEWLEDIPLPAGAEPVNARFYLLRLEEEGKPPPPEERRQQWLPLAAAKEAASFEETRGLLEKADSVLRRKKEVASRKS